MERRSAARWIIGILVALLLMSTVLTSWHLTRRQTPPSESPPDPFGDGFSFDIAGDPQPIPALRRAPGAEAQRARQFHLLTIDFTGPVRGLLDEVKKQTDLEFDLGDVDPTTPVQVKAESWPVSRVLHEAGLDQDDRHLVHRVSTGVRFTEGGHFQFSATPWRPDGKTLGWILRTDARIELPNSNNPPTLAWDVASIEAGAPMSFETCGTHSPSLVYVANPDPGPLIVKLRGTRSWYLDVPIEFRNPKDGDSWTGHGFKITIRWPDFEARSERPLPTHRLQRCLSYGDIVCYLRDGRLGGVYDSIGIGGGSGGAGRYGGRFGGREARDLAWCGCVNAPAKVTPAEVERSDSLRVATGPHTRHLAAYAAIHVDFRALIVEEFEVTSEPLSTK